MPCTAGIKVIAACVGVPVSDAYMMMGWNAVTAKHKELHPEVQQAPLARISVAFNALSPILPFDLPIGAGHVYHQGAFSALSQSPFRKWNCPDKGNYITAPKFN